MKARELFEMLINSSPERWDTTCDRLIAGDGEREAKRVGVCFKLTAELISKAAEFAPDKPDYTLQDVLDTDVLMREKVRELASI
jgi:hypothetical protein